MKAITLGSGATSYWNKFSNLEKQLLHCTVVYFLILGFMNMGHVAGSGVNSSLLPKGLFLALLYFPLFMTAKVFYYYRIDYRPNTHTVYYPGNDSVIPIEKVMTFALATVAIVYFGKPYIGGMISIIFTPVGNLFSTVYSFCMNHLGITLLIIFVPTGIIYSIFFDTNDLEVGSSKSVDYPRMSWLALVTNKTKSVQFRMGMLEDLVESQDVTRKELEYIVFNLETDLHSDKKFLGSSKVKSLIKSAQEKLSGM